MKKFSLFLLSLLVVFTLSCNKNENNDTPSISNTYSITLAGQINDENGQGIPNVIVQVGNKTDQTDANGIYLIDKASVNKSRAVVKATKNGYWNRSCGFIPSNSTVQYCNMVMPQKVAATSIQSSAGGTVTSAGATVVFPTNAFVTAAGMAYNGTVNITTKHLPTTDPNFGALIPGGDLMAEDNTGNSVKLISFGMIGVELKDNNGNALQLAPGVTATIQLPIASAQLATAPATIPLWYFDETKSLWIEEGTGTKQGNNYVGQVSHFSWWNCDQPTPAATISGYVYDNYGNPIVNAIIYYNNIGGTTTDQNGFYSGQVPSGLSSSIYATFIGVSSPIISIPPLTAGQFYNVPDIIFNGNSFGKFKANFVDCNNQPTSTYIQFNGATSNTFLYAPNGMVNAVILCGSQTVTVNYLNTQFDTSFTQPCYPDSIDLGTIVICDTSTNNLWETFVCDITSPIFNLNYQHHNYIDRGYSPLDKHFELLSYDPITSEFLDCHLYNIITYAPGTYAMTGKYSLYLDYYLGSTHYVITADTINPNLTLTILQCGAVGDTIEVSLNGNVSISPNISQNETLGVLNNLYAKCIRNW